MRQKAGFVFLGFWALVLGARWVDRKQDRLRVTFFDVGQGDSILVEFPDARAWLVDAGGGVGDWNMGSAELYLELARLGWLSLDAAVLTHPDQDHAYGFRGLFAEVRFDHFFFVPVAPHPLLGTLRRQARAQRIGEEPTLVARHLGVGKVQAQLIPVRAGTGTNNNALVVALEYEGCRVLLPGDIEASAEAALLPQLERVDLLKIAHHGSRTSTTAPFLDRTAPQWAVISVGPRNRYGHPAAAVLDRLRHRRVPVWRTDFHGYVRFSFFPGGEVACETALGPCGAGHCARDGDR